MSPDMPGNADFLLEVGAGAGLGLIAVSSVPGLVGLYRQFRSRAPKDNFYQDKDGKSTPEAVADFSNKWSKTLVVLFAAVGFASSLSLSVLSTLRVLGGRSLLVQDWLVFAAWVSGIPSYCCCCTWIQASADMLLLSCFAGSSVPARHPISVRRCNPRLRPRLQHRPLVVVQQSCPRSRPPRSGHPGLGILPRALPGVFRPEDRQLVCHPGTRCR